ncbi:MULTISPECIES: Hpt domain-containing protein [Pseudomonas syringae group]|uniref:Hpt domain-containing protein n=6 Tax=Pseudomonas syringae group TaxID=136849 RepID=A0AAW4DTQ6_PSESX|nr:MULTISPECIES: Hpt domain-containing protein [Pseudomonas syringae group]KPC06293.1 Hpt domain protein [Pseudomonas amygdali pv. lachrymans]AAO55483.1 Hpt domain protein [Pseudomonas syringae pv. tomato str. DC3000]AVI85755.1 histidine kinase [Pseudomonas syringae pv. tomato]EEB61402.1 Hpt domain protein [Pseudomonas syringae pv. tomato T1]EGH97053.1 Hpt domain protein [Pseudomonas amygdali pv. lachrymans str. M302278]
MSIHLDYSVLSALQEVMEDEYPTLLDVFLKDSEQRLAQLRLAVETGNLDLQELSLTAHSFKGSSSNMGALQLSQLCHQLEERARQNDSSDLRDLIGRIGSEYLTVRGLFNAERQLFIS